MARCFVICGPESAGNRLMGAILKLGGVKGSSSTDQPTFPGLTKSDEFWIRHYPQPEQLRAIIGHGYDVILLICAREPHALTQSMLERGHVDSVLEAKEKIRRAFLNVIVADMLELPFEIIPYEGWTDGSIAAFLDRYDLRRVKGSLSLPGQDVSSQYVNQNEKYYAVR